MKKTKAQKAVDKQIEQAWYKHGQNVQINMMDIPKVFAMGHKAVAEGQSVEEAVIQAVAQFKIS